MKNLKYSLFLLVMLSVWSSCEDRFTQTKNIDFPEHTPQLAITSSMLPEHPDPNFNSVPRIFVGHSLGILDQQSYDLIDNATIEFKKDGAPFMDFAYEPGGNIYLGTGTTNLTPGTYTMEVNAPGYEPVKATQTLPEKAVVSNTTFEFEKVPFDFDEELYDLLKIKIDDPEGEENFYSFDVKILAKDFQGQLVEQHVYTDSDDPLMEYGDQLSNIFPDITFDGKEYDIRLLFQSDWFTQSQDDIESIIIDIYTLSKDQYYYETSREQYWNADGNPFAEPVLIHNNVEGGYGIFTLTNIVRHIHVL